MIVRNALFAQNSGGSAIMIESGGGAFLSQSTFADNNRSFHILPTFSSFTLSESIIWGDVLAGIAPELNLSSCTIDEFGIFSDNTQNPLFETGLNGIDYLLSVNSPAIDQCAGMPPSAGLDLIGNTRISDGNYHESSDEVDIGAFEFLPVGSQTLTITKSGSGDGIINSQFGTVNCDPICSDEFATGFTVILQASPDEGSEFIGWSWSGCSGTGVCVVTLEQSLTVFAEFANGSDLIFKDGFE